MPRAKIDRTAMAAPTLTPAAVAMLNKDGISAAWLSEQMGIPHRVASRLLIASGAVLNNSRYRFPVRPPVFGERRACTASSPLTGSDFEDAGRA